MASTLLIRHAQASFGTDDYDRLSQLGCQQAALTGEYLAATAGPIARIVCGQHERQRATAELIAAKVRNAADGRPVFKIDPRLNELDIDACIEGLAPCIDDADGEFRLLLNEAKTSSRSYQKVIRRVFAEWQQLGQVSGGESWPDFSARAASVLRDITQLAGPGETTVVVSSGALIAAINRHVLGLSDSATYELFEAMQNCSITHFKHSGSRLSLSSFNETGFLAAIGALRGIVGLVTYR
jgi:broad specificity phosphatase PhoE